MSRLSLLLLLTVGCATPEWQPLEDPTHPTGSSTLTSLSSDQGLVAVNVDEGSVSLIGPRGEVLHELVVGRGPTRVTRNGAGAVISLRHDGEVVSVVRTGDRLEVVARQWVGSEPYGVVSREDGTRIYVAVSQDAKVLELDDDLTILRSWPIDGEPRWLALHPSGRSLIVAASRGQALSRVDLDDDAVTEVEIPALGIPSGRWGQPLSDTMPRVTGDPSFSPDGHNLGIPLLFVDSDHSTGGTQYYEPPLDPVKGTGRFNPALEVFHVDPAGRTEDVAEAITAPGVMDGIPRRGYPTSATFTPDGAWILATMEGADLVVAVSIDPAVDDITGPGAQLVHRPTTMIASGAGPRSVALTEGDAWVHTAFDRSVAGLP